jgi:hypothetical protein
MTALLFQSQMDGVLRWVLQWGNYGLFYCLNSVLDSVNWIFLVGSNTLVSEYMVDCRSRILDRVPVNKP